MFGSFKKIKNNNVYAPISGVCKSISECKDQTFSNKLIGDGVMIETDKNIISSPCDGTLEAIFPTLHAFGLKTEKGAEILIHIGIDTVNLNGKYFEQLCSPHKRIKRGTPIIRYENQKIRDLGYDTCVMVIVTGKDSVAKNHLGEFVCEQDIIIEAN